MCIPFTIIVEMTMSKKLNKMKSKREQLDVAIGQEEKKKADVARKALNSKKFQLGALAIKAGLGDWPINRYYGLLLVGAGATERKYFDAWEQRGGQALNHSQKVTAVAVFPGPIDDESAKKALRELGFKYCRVRKDWAGRVDANQAAGVVEKHGGTFRILA
jgi:hypothetical protein